jgi:cell division protein FtsW (lipid II flippase)
LISPTDRIERRLLILAGAFLGIFSLALTLSNAARLRTWQVDYRWSHWLAFAIWMGIVWLIHRQLTHLLPERDPFLFPVAALLTGWGLLTIWRLSSGLGLRQSAWLLLIGMVFLLALRYDCARVGGRILSYLRRFKYVWLTSGLVLTAATLVLGTNPLGAGPRLWLGCCGIYFQPSEPLKLLLIIYLAAYLADRQIASSPTTKLLPVLTPSLLMTGLALLLLIFQRDLGTAAIFMVLYAVIVYAGTGNKYVLFISILVLLLAVIAGYALFDVVHQRVDAWINPWLDPSGRSYQIVQSLLAVANGGVIGRGVGMGSPGLVPIAQSDFIFSAITEETGLLGALGILGLLALLVNRGMRTAMKSDDTFQRLLAIGLVVHLVGQSFLIIAGNLRLLPLTGVTLPFVSNGGSSLLVSFFELLCLILISARQAEVPVFQPEKLKAQNSLNLLLSGGLMLGLAGAALTVGWWSLVRGPDLLTRTDNPRRSIADRYVIRGSILDRRERPLAESTGQPGDIVRHYPYPALGPLVGYTDPVYGQAGLEASLDPYLRGLQGYPNLTMGWEHLLYGQPPPGLDVRLSLDLDLQTTADTLMAGHLGALVFLNANTGEILAMSSSPNFDANTLDSAWESLVNDPTSPLFDRAGMGMYPAGNVLGPFLLAASQEQASAESGGSDFKNCALTPTGTTWGEVIAAGCTEPVERLVSSAKTQDLIALLDELGLFTAPTFPVETLSSPRPGNLTDAYTYIIGLQSDPTSGALLRVSPLQMALAAAILSNQGERPTPRIVVAVDTPQAGWVMLPVTSQPLQALQAQPANSTAQALSSGELPIWQVVAADKEATDKSSDTNLGYAWYLGGTLPDWKGATLAIAVLLEENDPQIVQEIGRSMFQNAIYP